MKHLLIITICSILLSSCIKRTDNVGFDFTVRVSFEDNLNVSLKDIDSVVLVNVLNNRLLKAAIVHSEAVFKVEAGIYVASLSISVGKKIYSVYSENIDISKVQEHPFNLVLKEGVVSPLVIKEVYYSGCKPPVGRYYYADQFIEIYNNSNKYQSLKGLCLSTVVVPNNDPYLALHQMIWRFPDAGSKLQLAPGESVVIAQDAINHSNPLKSNSKVNLRTASYETFMDNGKDLDNANVENMSLIWPMKSKIPDWIVSPFGAACILFRLPENYNDFLSDDENMRILQGRSKKYLCIPEEFVLDGVECVKDDKRYLKKLHTNIDASYVFVSKAYMGYSVRRKVLNIDKGRVIYMDTNDSYNDFMTDQVPSPFFNPSIIEKDL